MDERVETNFSMAENFPEKCKEAFRQIIIGYVMIVAREFKKNKTKEEMIEFISNLLSSELGPRLFQITEKLTKLRNSLNQEYKNNRGYEDDEMLENYDVPLEFVKAICKALDLDKNTTYQVENLRSQLVQLLKIDSGAIMNDWHQPTTSCVLENIFCFKCNHCVTLDLIIPTG